jgi:hypothetical protein
VDHPILLYQFPGQFLMMKFGARVCVEGLNNSTLYAYELTEFGEKLNQILVLNKIELQNNLEIRIVQVPPTINIDAKMYSRKSTLV